MGEGVANIGQFFTAVAVEAVKIDITVSGLKKVMRHIQEYRKHLKAFYRNILSKWHWKNIRTVWQSDMRMLVPYLKIWTRLLTMTN